MIEKKLQKHLTITRTRLNQKAELKRISDYDNSTLNSIVKALLRVQTDNFTEEDRKAFAHCENYRKELLDDETVISYAIFGSDKTAKVKDICENAASGKKWCEFLYVLSKETRPENILEIGTNLGISGSYVLESIKDNEKAKFITMEGLSQLCEISADKFATIVPKSKFDIREGLFDVTFPKLLREDIRFDLLFIDGNHQKDPTIRYFETLKDKIESPAVFIFDDINWSRDMKDAWDTIKNNQDINFSLDLYKQGIVVIDREAAEKNVAFKLHLAY